MNTEPVTVQIVTIEGCQKCVAANRALAQTLDSVRGDYRIDVRELDLLDHLEVTAEYRIMATLAMIINDELAFVGSVKETELRERLTSAVRGDA